jgi:hypothetical protein
VGPVSPETGVGRSSVDESDDPEHDRLLEAACEHWSTILKAYNEFKDKKPIILYDIQEKRIYAYPYAEFKKDLSKKSQATLKEQYEAAQRNGKFVLFVRDNEAKRLVSYSLDLE